MVATSTDRTVPRVLKRSMLAVYNQELIRQKLKEHPEFADVTFDDPKVQARFCHMLANELVGEFPRCQIIEDLLGHWLDAQGSDPNVVYEASDTDSMPQWHPFSQIQVTIAFYWDRDVGPMLHLAIPSLEDSEKYAQLREELYRRTQIHTERFVVLGRTYGTWLKLEDEPELAA